LWDVTYRQENLLQPRCVDFDIVRQRTLKRSTQKAFARMRLCCCETPIGYGSMCVTIAGAQNGE
jgi:hypothetical protein